MSKSFKIRTGSINNLHKQSQIHQIAERRIPFQMVYDNFEKRKSTQMGSTMEITIRAMNKAFGIVMRSKLMMENF